MFIGHIAVALGAKKAAPKVSLLYLCATDALDQIGKYSFWSFIIFLIFVATGNILGGPPPSVTALAVVAMAVWLLVLWAYWIDRHRRPTADVGNGLQH